MVQLSTLRNWAIGVGITGGLSLFAMMNSVPYFLNKQLKQSEVYQEAMNMIRKHPEAIKYLGEPIIDGNVRVTNEEFYGSDEEKGWFSIPIKGSKSNGLVHCESRFKKLDDQVKAELYKVELTIQSLPGYKLMIKRAE